MSKTKHPLSDAIAALPKPDPSAPIVPATDEEIAGWLCGGRAGGCEDWPACEYCRMVARIEVEREAKTDLIATLRTMIASAHPNPRDHPMMTAAWTIARAAIAKAGGRS